jgi:hypothetical protein
MQALIGEPFGLITEFGDFWRMPGGSNVFMAATGFWELDPHEQNVRLLSRSVWMFVNVLQGLEEPASSWFNMPEESEDGDRQSVESIDWLSAAAKTEIGTSMHSKASAMGARSVMSDTPGTQCCWW